LGSGTDIATVFSSRKSIEEKRKNLMDDKKLPSWYPARGINSNDLNTIIEAALKL
jgi:hypothetical protein